MLLAGNKAGLDDLPRPVAVHSALRVRARSPRPAAEQDHSLLVAHGGRGRPDLERSPGSFHRRACVQAAAGTLFARTLLQQLQHLPEHLYFRVVFDFAGDVAQPVPIVRQRSRDAGGAGGVFHIPGLGFAVRAVALPLAGERKAVARGGIDGGAPCQLCRGSPGGRLCNLGLLQLSVRAVAPDNGSLRGLRFRLIAARGGHRDGAAVNSHKTALPDQNISVYFIGKVPLVCKAIGQIFLEKRRAPPGFSQAGRFLLYISGGLW